MHGPLYQLSLLALAAQAQAQRRKKRTVILHPRDNWPEELYISAEQVVRTRREASPPTTKEKDYKQREQHTKNKKRAAQTYWNMVEALQESWLISGVSAMTSAYTISGPVKEALLLVKV